MQRRKFIRNTGILGCSALLQFPARAKFLAGGEKIRVGVIGCGDRGTGLMQVMLELNDYFEIVAICDVLEYRLTYARKMLDGKPFKAYAQYQDLLEDKNVHAVINSTPLYLHYKISSDAILSGKHVYHEKTATFTIPEAMDLVGLVEKNEKFVFQVGHQYRYMPLYFRVKEMIEKDYLGKVTQIDCRWDRNWNWRRPVPAGCTDRQINWRMYKEYSGGLAAELLSHQMDFVNWVFHTAPMEIYGTGGIDFYKDGRETFDNVQLVLRYKEGMIGNFGATCGNAREGYIFKIKGTKGTVELKVSEGFYFPEAEMKKELQTVDGVTGATKIEWTKEGGISILNNASGKEGTWYALKEFYQSIQNKSLPASNIYTGAKTAILVSLANESMYTDTIQYWKPQFNLDNKI